MTQEELEQIQERYNAAYKMKLDLGNIGTIIKSTEANGLTIHVRGIEYMRINDFIDAALYDRITQMVIDALNAKRDELQKEFDKL